VTDLDEQQHFFGPGDTVILPKGWSGRWDVFEQIHKVWFVHDHPNIEETNPIRATITPYSDLIPRHLLEDSEDSKVASQAIYNVGPTEVGCLMCQPNSFPIVDLSKTECFHVLEGVFFITDANGNSRRCVVGDTVVLPKGWSGTWDVIEASRKLRVAVE